jgi:hypothetical protein
LLGHKAIDNVQPVGTPGSTLIAPRPGSQVGAQAAEAIAVLREGGPLGNPAASAKVGR